MLFYFEFLLYIIIFYSFSSIRFFIRFVVFKIIVKIVKKKSLLLGSMIGCF